MKAGLARIRLKIPQKTQKNHLKVCFLVIFKNDKFCARKS